MLHWAAGADGRGALLSGDSITVVQDRRIVETAGPRSVQESAERYIRFISGANDG